MLFIDRKYGGFTFFVIFFSISLSAQSIDHMIKSKPIEFSGSLSGLLSNYSVTNIDKRTAGLTYGLRASLTTSIYGINLPVFVSYRDNTFNFAGPYNRIRISPSYKWISTQIGDVYMNFNPYVLSGRTVRGIGLSLTPGKFRFKALYGKIEDLRSFSDTLSLGVIQEPTYSRKLAGMSLGFGGQRTSFELMANKTWDKLDSIDRTSNFNPQSNLVVGAHFKVRLAKRILIESNAGYSFITTNLDTYGENEAFGRNAVTENLFEYNLSSGAAFAGDGSIRYNGRGFGLFVQSQYIQPYYQPLSIAYINSDVFNNTLGGNVSLFQSKIFISGQVGLQSNNLSGSKSSTTNRLITNSRINWKASKQLNIGFTFFNYSQDYSTSLVNIANEVHYAITSQNLRGNISYHIPIGENRLRMGFSAGKSQFETITDTQENNSQTNNSLNLSLNTGMDFKPQMIKVNLSIYNTNIENPSASRIRRGISASGSKSFLDIKLSIQVRTSFTQLQKEGFRESDSWINNLGVTYNLGENMGISGGLSYAKRLAAIAADFDEWRSSLRFHYKF